MPRAYLETVTNIFKGNGSEIMPLVEAEDIRVGTGAVRLDEVLDSIRIRERAEANPIVIPDGSVYPAQLLTLPMPVVQSAEGDPSPQNVRPFVPRTGVTLYISPTDSASAEGARTIEYDWEEDVGNVYFASLNVLTGLLTVRPYYASYNGETLAGRWVSSMGVYNSTNPVPPPVGSEVVDTGGTIASYQLSPETVMLLKGENHLWTDADRVILEYFADTKLYIDKKIAEELA